MPDDPKKRSRSVDLDQMVGHAHDDPDEQLIEGELPLQLPPQHGAMNSLHHKPDPRLPPGAIGHPSSWKN